MASPPKIRPSGPPLPTMAQLLAAHDAAVQHGKGRQPFLASDGSPLAVGSHINTKPTRHQIVNGVQVSQVLAPYVAPAGTPPAPIVITPGDPSDIGPVIAPTSPLWCPRTPGDGGTVRESNQGYNCADCYYLVGPQSFGISRPNKRKTCAQRIAPGVIQSTFTDSSGQIYLVQSNANISSNGQYNKPEPTSGAFGICIAEKAFAWFRDRVNTYASLWEGYWGEPLGDHGCAYAYISLFDPNLVTLLQAAQVGGWACTAGTMATTKIAVASHAYSFDGIQLVNGQWIVTMRNPWGYNDFVGTIAQLQADFSTFAVVNNYGTIIPTPGDATGDGVVDFSDGLMIAQHFGQKVPPNTLGDVNGDGVVDFGDELLYAQNFGKGN